MKKTQLDWLKWYEYERKLSKKRERFINYYRGKKLVDKLMKS